MRKSAQLPRTSRVNDKIREYYLKFGQDRDLEKYMRLYSPCGSRSDCKSRSSTTTNSEDEGRSIRRLFHQKTDTSTESECEPKEFIVPIEMQPENTIGKCLMSKVDECTSSAPDLHTPPPSNLRKGQTKQTQTPDSIAKSHRRLEWDSLGDVGYKKSLSTSNISILERSVLKEYFQEISSISSSKKVVDTSVNSKTTKKLVEAEILTTKNPEKTSKQNMPESNTPPLASSTMMQSNKAKKCKSQPKLVSKSTSMSLQKRYDQYAQTSRYAPPQHTSREVQVTLSNTPSGTSSTDIGTATPSSFDYYSSRSARSTTDDENRSEKSALKSVHKNVKKSKINEEGVHPFVAEINEMLAACKGGDTSKQHSSKKPNIVADLQKVHDTLKQVISENKENASETSSLINSPQLDLGIQLLCSLIDARSLSQRQKKRLVRDIVKRISTLSPEGDNNAVVSHINNAITARAEISETQMNENKNGEATLETNSAVTVARTAKATMDMSELASNLPSSTSSEGVDEQLVRVNVLKRPSLPTTSAKARAQLANKNTEHEEILPITHLRISAGTQVEESDVTQDNKPGVAESLEFEKTSTTKAAANLDKDTDKDSSASKASTTSKDLTTQKALINIESGGASDTDGDVAAHSTMREWLNPMTQSEIEYEQKKLEMASIASRKNKLAKCLESDKIEPERQSQLQWIQSEIERLETLRCLLLKPNMERVHTLENNAVTPLNVEKLYDTVFTDTKVASSSGTTTTTSTTHSSKSDKSAMQEIEVIIEESNEDEIKLDKKTKSSKQRKRETQIIYDKPTEATNIYDNLVAGKARFRTMTETVTIKEEQVLPTTATLTDDARTPPKQLPTAKERPQQRSKIDTPSVDSNDSESVRSFAQQRKREFLEQYRNKRRTHYESLLHQQQQMLIQQQQQIIQELQQRCNTITHSTAAPTTAHYSVPHNLPNAYCPCASAPQPPYHQAYFQQQQHNNMCAQARTNSKRLQMAQPHCPPPCPPRVQSQQADALNYSHKTQTIHSEQSTSSIFCISSEVSIPMGTSSTTSSTTTTTHQYDDVAGVTVAVPAVGVQTGDSLRRSQPIFGKRFQYNSVRMNAPHCYPYNPQPVSSGQSICVQVKPKAIAYVIQFEKKTTSSTTTTTTTTTSASTASAAAASNQSTPQPSSESNDLHGADSEVCALQDYLVRAKPQFIAHTKERKAILNQIQMLREQRGRELRDIIENASENSLETRLQHLPPPATKRLRIFATKEMKAMTQRHCENLPEVLKQQERKREERRRQGNRLIRDLFNQRLQRRVRTGKLSLNHSKTVI